MTDKLKKLAPALAALVFGLGIALTLVYPVLFDSNTVQDDFRQTNFWFWRFWDPELFKNDFFAEINSQSMNALAPLYLLVWRLMPLITDNLIFASKLYVIILSALSALAAYLFINKFTKGTNTALSLGFTLAMSITFWCTDHLPAAHVRSSIWLILFLYMWLKESKRDILASGLCTLALFSNPTAFLLCMGMEGLYWLLNIKSKVFTSSFYLLVFNSLITIGYHFLYLGGIRYSGKGSHLSYAEMISLPEFNLGGRHLVFCSSIWDGSWWMNEHWGLGVGYLAISSVIIIGLLLTMASGLLLKPKETEIKAVLTSSPLILLYSSILLYTLSSMVFPLLYFPSRYIGVTALILGVLSIFLCTSSILNKFFAIKNPKYIKTALVMLTLIFWMFFQNHYHARFISANPEMNKLIAATPINSLIAAHPKTTDINLAYATAKRNVFIDRERSIGFTMDSINEIRRRNKIALQMTYARSENEFMSLARENGISHFLAAYDFYTPEYYNRSTKYDEPYNKYIEQLINPLPSNGFFIQTYLEQQGNPYMLIELNL